MFSKVREIHEGDGEMPPNNEAPSIADGGADAVRERGSTSSNLGTWSWREVATR